MREDNMAILENELNRPVALCAANGNLNPAAVGFSRRPLHTCNLSGHWPRKKRWNYWCVTTPDFLFSITLSNIDYMGLAFAYYLDFASKRFIEQTVMVPLGRGFDLPDTVTGDIRFDHPQMKAAFLNTPEGTTLQVESPAFGGSALSADLRVVRPTGHESVNVVIPWSQNRFQFTSKQNCLPVVGLLNIGKETRPVENAFACLDFGRGVWPYQSFWNWSSFSGPSGSSVVGVNLGAGWTDGTGLTENGLCLDGKLEKLSEDVEFSYDPKDFMKPWRLRTKSSAQVDLVFTPFYERIAKTDLGVLRSEVHQMIGRFSGTLTSRAGVRFAVENLAGWAEDHHARW
jgi:hypothetical protein